MRINESENVLLVTYLLFREVWVFFFFSSPLDLKKEI